MLPGWVLIFVYTPRIELVSPFFHYKYEWGAYDLFLIWTLYHKSTDKTFWHRRLWLRLHYLTEGTFSLTLTAYVKQIQMAVNLHWTKYELKLLLLHKERCHKKEQGVVWQWWLQ